MYTSGLYHKSEVNMTKKLIDRLEELADEMKVIVHQLRGPSTIVEDVIKFAGQQYKKVDREAREGDVVRYKNTTSGQFNRDNFYKVLHPIAWSEGSCRVIGKDGDDYPLYQRGVGRTSKETDVYELIVEDKPKIQGIAIEIEAPKSPNQQRAEVIEKAKLFIEETKNATGAATGRKGYRYDENKTISDVVFHVNAEKRTVVALLKRQLSKNEIINKGIAKCMPTDVFNEHIGKAIALGRALGLDVSEFENAVQPSHYAVGQIGINSLGTSYPFEIIKIGKGAVFKKNFNPYDHSNGDTTKPLNFEDENYKALTIINDTNAEYEVI